MIEKIKALCLKHRELIVYGIFGVLTTLVNYLSYVMLTRLLSVGELVATGISFVLSVIFAYVTNRKYVFKSTVTGAKGIAKEMGSFFLARIFSGALDLAIMYVFVTLLLFNDLIIKILSNVIVIIVNFVISKVFVFKKKKVETNVSKDISKDDEE